MTSPKDKTGAERQRRYRQSKLGAGYTRVQLYVPDSVVDQLTAIADILTKNPSTKFIEVKDRYLIPAVTSHDHKEQG